MCLNFREEMEVEDHGLGETQTGCLDLSRSFQTGWCHRWIWNLGNFHSLRLMEEWSQRRCTVSWTGSLVRCNQCSCWLKLRKECWWNLDVAESGCKTRCDCLFSATWARRFSCPRRGRWQSAGYPSSKWGFQAGKQSHPHLCLVHSKPQRVQHLARDRSCTCHSLLQTVFRIAMLDLFTTLVTPKLETNSYSFHLTVSFLESGRTQFKIEANALSSVLYSCFLLLFVEHQLTIGSCFSVHYRVMEHAGSLEST